MKQLGQLISVIAFFVICFSACTDKNEEINFNEGVCPSGDLTNLHLLLGNPSNAETDAENSANNYLLLMDEYAISYNKDRAIPNWVSWHLSDEWFDGDGERQNDFRANPFLPSDWLTPNSGSYSGSGFDRGHNCPSADRLCSDGTNSATFFMTNMVPQSPYHNQELWKHWECYFRYLANQGNELYIIMGNYGKGGDGSYGYKETITDHELLITVPQSIWKVAIAIPKGNDNDLIYVDENSTVIAIDIPNSQQVADFDFNDPQFITTVDAIEQAMGDDFDLFSNLSNTVQSTLENQVHSTESSFTPCW